MTVDRPPYYHFWPGSACRKERFAPLCLRCCGTVRRQFAIACTCFLSGPLLVDSVTITPSTEHYTNQLGYLNFASSPFEAECWYYVVVVDVVLLAARRLAGPRGALIRIMCAIGDACLNGHRLILRT